MPDLKCTATRLQQGGFESHHDESAATYTFLATAIVQAKTIHGNYVNLRVLFDEGSQLNLISDQARQLLGLRTSNTSQHIQLSGINNSTVTLRKRMFVELKSTCTAFSESVMLMVHPKLCQMHPSQHIDTSGWKLPNNIKLADPEFNQPQYVDIILNAHQVDMHALSNTISLGNKFPRLRETTFGWVVIGDCANTTTCYSNVTTISKNEELSSTLKRFWEVEHIPTVPILSEDDQAMELHFSKTTERLPDGRFVVRLPFFRSPELLGETREIAKRRLSTIIRKVASQEEYGKSYNEFIDEYVELGHCSEIDTPVSKEPHYYIPHFAVTNENSTTTRTRVVFDASCASENGISLNELLHVGPRLQDDLTVHLLRFRLFKFTLVGDISKMYRQILVHPDDRRFQYILWKKPGETKLRTLELNTVTYGTASAPYQSVRCLKEIANVDGGDLPLGKNALLKNFYVDDMLAGSDEATEIIELYHQIKTLLSRGQMQIKKFQTNCKDALHAIPEVDRGTFLKIGDDEVIKTLGKILYPDDDIFSYYYEPRDGDVISRRQVLSEIGRLFDPLGLISPVVIRAKIFMQHLFTTTKDWDEPLSTEESQSWQQFRQELKTVSCIGYPRAVIDQSTYIKQSLTFEIHGFSDASEKAYAAALYIRAIQPDDLCGCRIYVAKTKVAPLKKVSLPRLELLGAELLSELYQSIMPHLSIKITRSVMWVDSTITLRWVTESPHKWTSYVATRVTKIQNRTSDCVWRHIPTQINPADLATRGMSPMELSLSELWKEGPMFLRTSFETPWPHEIGVPSEVPETKKQVTTLSAVTDPDLLSRCKIMSFVPLITAAAWPKLRRIFAYVSRFITVIRQRTKNKFTKCLSYHNVPPLDVSEVDAGTVLIIRLVERASLLPQMNTLVSKKPLPPKSKAARLGVIYDEKNAVLRVGGRTRNADAHNLPFLLPDDHIITKLIFVWYHHENLHAGPTALLAFVRDRFWPFNGKVLANRTVHGCIRCTKSKPVTYQQIMGDLPADRMKFMRPFEVSAVDFAGPFTIHYRLRGSKPVKVYMAVFVCFATKAVHLDIVEDLTTEAFINCLHRFTNRRSTPRKIWSDNATNFAGANNLLKEFKKFFFDKKTQQEIHDWCRDHKGLSWNFTPPRSPHFNGLVEAAVKSAKYFLVRRVQEAHLTYPELLTVVTMVEGILIARPLESQPEQEVDLDHRKRWDNVVAVKQDFWKKWSRQYLHTLQERNKWTKECPGPQLDDLVLLVDNNVAPMKWKVGKVTKLYHGKDGKVRIVDVTTNAGTYTRGITEVCPLPRKKSVLA